MKKILHILPMLTVVLFTSILSVIPHHHHGQVVCVVMELCNTDDSNSNNHASEDASKNEGLDHNGVCKIKTQYIPSSNIFRSNFLLDGDENQYITQYFWTHSSEPELNTQPSVAHIRFKEDIVLYESSLLGLCCGLRAPPYVLS